MLTRLIGALVPTVLLVCSAASAQEPVETDSPDTTYSDTTYTDTLRTSPDDEYAPADSDYYDGQEPDTSYGEFETPEASAPAGAFAPGAGFYGGPTFEVTTLDPHKLDPALDGDLVLYGGQVYAIINGWVIGGHWTSATLYNLSPAYDQFDFSYGGFLTGYDLNIYGGLSARASLLIGGGDLNMVKKRPDLAQYDSTGHTLLERYRSEGFFLVRPGASIGYSPLPFLDLRFSVDYLYPIGGAGIGDLKALTYGLHVMLGVGK